MNIYRISFNGVMMGDYSATQGTAAINRAALEHGTTPDQATVDFPGGVWSCVKVS